MPWVLVVDDEDLRLRVPLTEGPQLVGSGSDADLVVSHPTVSRRHALVRPADDGVWLEDAGSSNGTRVAGRTVTESVRVPHGAPIHFGSVVCRLEATPADELEPAVDFGPFDADSPADSLADRRTLNVGPVRTFVNETLPAVVSRLEEALRGTASDASGTSGALNVVHAAGRALYDSLPCRWLEIRERGAGSGEQAVVFRVGAGSVAAIGEPPRDEPEGDERGEEVQVQTGEFEIRLEFTAGAEPDGYLPLVSLAGRLASLAWPRISPSETSSRDGDQSVGLPEPATVDPVLRRIYDEARRVARGDVGVLIEGESGTGKELLAQFVHAASPRRQQSLVVLNCAALPRDLLEAELFGIEKGVATGVEARAGKFEAADGGTLFLDEIGDMALETQAKILRVLQESEVYRLGGRSPRPARVRVIAATHRDLQTMIDDGSFRLDLYHRIADCRFRLPPLRERLVDLPNLAAHFLLRAAEEHGTRARGISKAALESLSGSSWPGNVRQLEREMARAALFLEDGDLLQNRHLQQDLWDRSARSGTDRSLKGRLDSFERGILTETLARHGGSVRSAAEELAVGRTTLYRRLNELGITP